MEHYVGIIAYSIDCVLSHKLVTSKQSFSGNFKKNKSK